MTAEFLGWPVCFLGDGVDCSASSNLRQCPRVPRLDRPAYT